MTKFIVIASGKGGVGKTTLAINLATALTNCGRTVTVVDGNLSTPNISIYLGSPNLDNTIHDVLRGVKKIKESAYMHESGVKVIPGNINKDAKVGIDISNFHEYLTELDGTSEIVIIDTSNISEELAHIMAASDQVMIVTNPELPAVADALKMVHLANDFGCRIMGVVLNRVRGDNMEMTVQNVETILEQRVIATIPEDGNMRMSLLMKHPLVFSHPGSDASLGYKALASKLIGEKSVEIAQKDSMYDYMVKHLGIK